MTLLFSPRAPPVLCTDDPRRGALLQHLLLSEAALLPGEESRGHRRCAAGSRGPHRGRGLHAAGHRH